MAKRNVLHSQSYSDADSLGIFNTGVSEFIYFLKLILCIFAYFNSNANSGKLKPK